MKRGFASIVALGLGLLLAGSTALGYSVYQHLKAQIAEQEAAIEEARLGAFNFVSSGTYTLAGGGISSSATSVAVDNFVKPVSEQHYDMATDFGSIGYITLEPGSATNKEFASFTGFTYSGDRATLTGVIRGLEFNSPYTASSTLRRAHAGGTKVIISNPPQLYNQLAVKQNTEYITGSWGFQGTAPTSTQCATPNELCNKSYVDATANQGAATSTFDNGGLVELANFAEFAAGTASSSPTGPLVPSNRFFNATPASCSSIACGVVAVAGKIAHAFLDLTQSFAWTGAHTHTGDNTFNGGGTATSTFNRGVDIDADADTPLILRGLSYIFPPAISASSTVLTTNASGSLIWGTENPNVVAASGVTTSSSGTATSTVTVTIPAGAMTASALVRVHAVFGDTGSNGLRTIIEAGNGVSTTTLYYAAGNCASCPTQTRIVDLDFGNNGALNSQTYTHISTTTSPLANVVGTPSGMYNGTASIDTATQWYLSFGFSDANGATSATLRHHTVQIMK